jgi:nucleoside 2-deoxyribosyltransferase
MVSRATVYLAGGMHSDWREQVKMGVQHTVNFFDPCTHGFKSEDAYTFWDIQAIRKSDIVFAYMEPDNPSGVGLAFEIGYAVALGRSVIFVDQSSEETRKYWGMCRAASTVTTTSITEGIHLLNYTIDLITVDPSVGILHPPG